MFVFTCTYICLIFTEISTPNINYPGLQWAAANRCDFLKWFYATCISFIVIAI